MISYQLRALFCALSMSAMIFGCGGNGGGPASTETTIRIEADESLRSNIRSFRVVVRNQDASTREDKQVDTTSAFFSGWPFRVALTPKVNAAEKYEVVAEAFDANGASIVRTRAISGFLDGQRAELVLSFLPSCPTNCPAGFSCGRDPFGLTACIADERLPLPVGSDAGVDSAILPDATIDASEDAAADASADASLPQVDQLDLLFMIDNSGSMKDERNALSTELPRLLNALSTGDTNSDGVPDRAPVQSIHLGVITSDMGVSDDISIQGCSALGDDGILQRKGESADTACSANYPSALFSFESGTGDSRVFAQRFSCVVRGVSEGRPVNGGCGLEQQLEAALKALSPAQPLAGLSPNYRAPIFFAGTGHGGNAGANAGFLRENSALALLLVSDEEDSSTLQPNLSFAFAGEAQCSTNPFCISTANGRVAVGANVRSAVFGPGESNEMPGAFSAISRYVQGFAALRRDPRLFIYSAIVGVPTVSELANRNYTSLLAAPAMQYTPCPTFATLTQVCGVPTEEQCSSGGAVGATPGRRFVRVAQELQTLGASTSVHSICETGVNGLPNFQGAVDSLISQVFAVVR